MNKQLEKEINETHKRGVSIWRKIRELLRTERSLERLNKKRRKKLQESKHFITMYDSVDISQIPDNPEAVAGYVNGKYQNFQALRKRFPRAFCLSITINAQTVAHCLDVEKGDAKPNEVIGWVSLVIRHGVRKPVLYAARLESMSEVIKELELHGMRSSVKLWIADVTEVPHIPVGFDACQWTFTSHGRNLDQSLCNPSFF